VATEHVGSPDPVIKYVENGRRKTFQAWNYHWQPGAAMSEHLDPKTNRNIQHEKSNDRQQERWEAMKAIEQGQKPWQEHEGVMSVVTAVRDCEFPCSFERLREDVGDREVVTTRNKTHTLGTVLDVLGSKVDPTKDPLMKGEEVPSLRDFESIVQRHWEAVQFYDVPDEQKSPKGGPGPQARRGR
jgi:hypothetical protein